MIRSSSAADPGGFIRRTIPSPIGSFGSSAGLEHLGLARPEVEEVVGEVGEDGVGRAGDVGREEDMVARVLGGHGAEPYSEVRQDPAVAKRKRREREPVETFDYTDPEGNVLTLRGELSAGTIRKLAERRARPPPRRTTTGAGGPRCCSSASR